jgi:uncharacterized Tic20 family protein
VPLLVYLIKTDGSVGLRVSAKEALNFQITVAIGLAIGLLIPIIGGIAIAVILLANVVLCIMAAAAISDGKDYRYPFAIRLIT